MPSSTAVGGEMMGIRIKNARIKAQLRLADVAAATGVSPSMLSRVETGRRTPSEKLIARLADVLQLDPGTLTGPKSTRSEAAARAAKEAHWPAQRSDLLQTSGDDAISLADLALSAGLREAHAHLSSRTSVERFRACKTLAVFASRPLEVLIRVSLEDDDPIVRAAACQLLATLTQTCGEREEDTHA